MARLTPDQDIKGSNPRGRMIFFNLLTAMSDIVKYKIQNYCYIWRCGRIIINNNVGYFHCSSLIFFLCSSKQCYWLDKLYFTIFNNHTIKFFGKLIMCMKIVPQYETNHLNIFPYFTRMSTIFYYAIEISTKQFSFFFLSGGGGIFVPSIFFV